MGEHGWLRPSTSISTQQGSFQGDGSGLSPNDTDCTGLANRPWFWDLVNQSAQVPFMLPLQQDLVTQPFNGLPH